MWFCVEHLITTLNACVQFLLRPLYLLFAIVWSTLPRAAFFLTLMHLNYQCLFSSFLGRYKLFFACGAGTPRPTVRRYVLHMSREEDFTMYAVEFSHYSFHGYPVTFVKLTRAPILISVSSKLRKWP